MSLIFCIFFWHRFIAKEVYWFTLEASQEMNHPLKLKILRQKRTQNFDFVQFFWNPKICINVFMGALLFNNLCASKKQNWSLIVKKAKFYFHVRIQATHISLCFYLSFNTKTHSLNISVLFSCNIYKISPIHGWWWMVHLTDSYLPDAAVIPKS